MVDTATLERRPDVRVLLSPGLPRENTLPKAAVGGGLGAIDITAAVTRARTCKVLRSPNGTWEIGCTFAGLDELTAGALTDTRALSTAAVPQNLIDIAFSAGVPGSELQTVMQGPITSIRAREVPTRRGPQRGITISGEDWGGLLVHHQIPAHQFTAYLQGHGELVTRAGFGALLQGPVGRVCKNAFEAIFVNRLQPLQLQFQKGRMLEGPPLPGAVHDSDANGLYLIDVDEGLFQPEAGNTIQGSIWHRQGSLWTALKGLADEPWNELFADYDPAYVRQGPGDGLERIPPGEGAATPAPHFFVRLRHRPFDQRRWEQLETHVVADAELLFQEQSLADDERVNWILVELSQIKANTEHDLNLASYMIRRFDQVDAERAGARLLRLATPYCDLPGGRSGESLARDPDEQNRFMGGAGRLFELGDDRATRAWNMFAINHRLTRASWVIPLRPEIRIGHRVSNQREPSPWFVRQEATRRTHYVEQVVHDWVRGNERATTHLGLTRGMPLDEFLIPAVDGKAAA